MNCLNRRIVRIGKNHIDMNELTNKWNIQNCYVHFGRTHWRVVVSIWANITWLLCFASDLSDNMHRLRFFFVIICGRIIGRLRLNSQFVQWIGSNCLWLPKCTVHYWHLWIHLKIVNFVPNNKWKCSVSLFWRGYQHCRHFNAMDIMIMCKNVVWQRSKKCSHTKPTFPVDTLVQEKLKSLPCWISSDIRYVLNNKFFFLQFFVSETNKKS